jgi:hypothetical protein
MNRRTFLAASGVAGVMSGINVFAAETEGKPGKRDFYELRRYHVVSQTQKEKLLAHMKDAEIPALNRAGVKPVGLFVPANEFGPVFVFMKHNNLQSMLNCTSKLLADQEYLSKGADFLNAPAEAPAYQRVESSLMAAFKGMPRMETPTDASARVFQLRIYESPSVKTGQKKIEMFNDAGEITIFRRVGLNPVFFGETLVGGQLPNLTYMLGFENEEAMNAGWKKFGSDPDWKKLRTMEEYADKKILCGITNIVLKPAEGSQI